MDLKRVIRLLKTSPWLVPVLAGINWLLWLTDQLAIWTMRPVAPRPNSLAVLRFDVLGDYLLFRTYLRYLKTQSAYRHHHLTLVGNQAFSSLAETLDADLIDAFVWVDIYKLSTRPAYRFGVVRRLRALGAETAFCPTYSRVLVLDDFMAATMGATERVGCYSDGTNLSAWEQHWGNRQYTRLLTTSPGYMFEGSRNQQILAAFLQQAVPALPPFIDASTLALPPAAMPEPYMVIALGAGQAFRIWPAERFAAVATYLQDTYPSLTLVLTGTAHEQPLASAFLTALGATNRVIDLTGRLTLPWLIGLLSRATLLLANESGTVHLAASVRKPAVVISQGKALVRWHPYPPELAVPIHYVYPPQLEAQRSQFTQIAPAYNPESPLAITAVTVDQVISQVARWLPITLKRHA